jgi:hypothetical protein
MMTVYCAQFSNTGTIRILSQTDRLRDETVTEKTKMGKTVNIIYYNIYLYVLGR